MPAKRCAILSEPPELSIDGEIAKRFNHAVEAEGGRAILRNSQELAIECERFKCSNDVFKAIGGRAVLSNSQDCSIECDILSRSAISSNSQEL